MIDYAKIQKELQIILLDDPALMKKFKDDKLGHKFRMALHLFQEIAKAEGKMPPMDMFLDYEKVDKDWILTTFSDCIKSIEGNY